MQSTLKATSKIVLERVHTFFQYDINVLTLVDEAELSSSGKSK